MSECCLIDLSKNKFNYPKQNSLARKLVMNACKNNYGIQFDYSEYSPLFVRKFNMNYFFFVSESFLFCNTELCYFPDLAKKEELDNNQVLKSIKKKFYYLLDCISFLKKNEIKTFDIYITVDDYCDEDENLYKNINMNSGNYEDVIINYFKDNIEVYLSDFVPIIFHYSDK